MFGGSHEHVDPKTGLALYGPYCPPGLGRPALSSIIVGQSVPRRWWPMLGHGWMPAET